MVGASIMTRFSLLLVFALAPMAAMAKDPEVTVTRIENMPNKLFYFDDTQVCGSLHNTEIPLLAR